MKDLLIIALDEALVKIDRITPITKTISKSIDIIDIKPLELASFMKDNNIPEDAYFDGEENSYDGWHSGIINLTWDIQIPNTEKDKLAYKKRRFDDIAFKFVYDTLIANGYKRKGVWSNLLKEFDDTNVYEMYIDKDFDRLIKYYSMRFSLVN